jgi:ParB/RepB/Spo0J family partition protein
MSHLVEEIPGVSVIPLDVIFTMSPLDIKVNKDLPRWRKEMGDVRELAESIKTKGQIHPVLLDRDNNLVCGGRRMAACITAGISVKAAYTDQVDPLVLRELELEENLRRKAFTPGEEVLAVQELHNLKVAQHGVACSGKQGGWTLDQTAALVGKTRGSVINDLQLAQAVLAFPELGKATKKNAIAKAMKGMERLQESIAGINKHTAAMEANVERYKIYHGDSIPYMKKLESGSIDVLFTDPMYGINADKTAIGVGGVTGGLTSAGFAIDDSADPALAFLRTLATESSRFCSPMAHGYIFVGPEFFSFVRQLFVDAGWQAYIKPIIWIKAGSGQCNVPYAWPASCYEMAIYVRKKDSKLVKEGQPDWLECQAVNPTVKTHPYEKPVGLIRNLLERVCYPGQTMYDPCMGSGASVEAGLEQKMFVIAGDMDMNAYSSAISRISKL